MHSEIMEILLRSAVLATVLAGCSGGASPMDGGGQEPAARVRTLQPEDAAAVSCADASPPSLDGVLGNYRVESVAKFRGGLTTQREADERVGGGAVVTRERFEIDGREVSAPKYSLQCHDVSHVEGEVPAAGERLLGTFYGFGLDRRVVWELTVEDALSREHVAAFEVVPGAEDIELWRMYDGWIYVLRRRD